MKIESVDEPIRLLVVKETPDEWRLWKAFTSMLGRNKDLALRVYASLLEKGEQTSSRELASRVEAPLYSVRRALKDLYDLDIVSRTSVQRGYLTFDYWSVKKQILGVLRLIPEQYFKEGYPKHLKEDVL